MGMCFILSLFVWETSSYELGISFVMTKIATKMTSGFDESEIRVLILKDP